MDVDVVTSLPVLLALLTGLALVDSLSFGTLAIPVWLLMAPGQLRIGRMLVYLATIASFYLGLGVVLLFTARFASDRLQIDWSHPLVMVLGFVIGLGLLVFSFVLEPPKFWRDVQSTEQGAAPRGMTSRMTAWRQSMVQDALPATGAQQITTDRRSSDHGAVHLVSLALLAGVLEVATMLPYLAAIGLLTASTPVLGLTPVHGALLLVGYCAVMIVPTLGLLVGRILFSTAVTPLLQRIDTWFITKGQSTIAWLIGIVGVVLMLNTWPVLQQVLAELSGIRN